VEDLYYRVYVEGAGAGYDLSSDLTSLTVEEASGKADQLTLLVSDPHKVVGHALQKGLEVEVDLGRVDDHSVVFRGMICKVEGDFPPEGVPTFRVLAYDRSAQMGLRKRNRVWTDVTLSNIVDLIAKEYFMVQDIHIVLIGEPTFSGNGIRQQNETDLCFLLRLAAMYGCEMFVLAGDHADELHFEAQYQIMTKEPAATLSHGRCGVPNRLISFKATDDVSQIQLPRTYAGLDYATGQPLKTPQTKIQPVKETEASFFDENMAELFKREPAKARQLQDLLGAANAVQEALRKKLGQVTLETTPGFATQQDLDIKAQNQFSTSLHGMRGSGTAAGNHRLHAQSTVNIADVGGGFSNTWYLSQVRHILDGQGYRTEFECQR
jgi:phage protein D